MRVANAKRKKVQSVLEELNGLTSMKTLYEMYRLATEDEDYSFWYILLLAKKTPDMVHICYDKRMTSE